jgi:hypothetical protein
MSRSEYVFRSFGIPIPYKNIAVVLTVAIPTISLGNHKSVICQKNWQKDIPGYIEKANRNWPGVLK